MRRKKFDDEDFGEFQSGNKPKPKARSKSKSVSNAPVKNQLWCVESNQSKLKFESKAKADNHLKWLNPDDFEEGRMPIRSYYCKSCVAFHVTSQRTVGSAERQERRKAMARERAAEREKRRINADPNAPDCVWKYDTFKSRNEALNHLDGLNPDDFIPGKMPFRTYCCKWCRLWHITATPIMTKEELAEKAAVKEALAKFRARNPRDKKPVSIGMLLAEPTPLVLTWCKPSKRERFRFNSRHDAIKYGERIINGEIQNARPPREVRWCASCKAHHLFSKSASPSKKASYTSVY